MSTDLEQQPLECQAGIPAGHDGVAKRLGRGQAELEHPAVTLQHPRSAPEQLHVGAQLFRGHPACEEEKTNSRIWSSGGATNLTAIKKTSVDIKVSSEVPS